MTIFPARLKRKYNRNKKFFFSKLQNIYSGAGSGLGAGVSKQLAAKGVTVICWDVNVRGNINTVNEIINSGGKAFSFKCDVSNREEVYAVAKESAKIAGDVTILVNNAGVVGGKSFVEEDDKMILKTFEVNAISHFWTTKAFLPKMMEKNHGHIGKKFSSKQYLFSFLTFLALSRSVVLTK